MRIGIDATLLYKGRYTGIENYTLNLFKSLLKVDHINRYVLFFRKKIPNELKIMASSFDFMISPTSNRIITDQIWMPIAVKKMKIDLLHCPAFPSPLLSNCHTVLTIHDAVHWRYPETISKGGRYYYSPLFPTAISKATRIISVSNSTRKDLISFFPRAKDKIRVIYEATDPVIFTEKTSEPYNRGRELRAGKYILTVGSIEPRKNLQTLLKAFKIVRKRINTDISLVVVGRKAWLKELYIPEEIKHKIILTGYITSNDDLAQIYRDALLFVLPSIYEGFGLPVLEAMSTGTPVLCSNTSSLSEIAGNAAEYFDPYNPNDFADRIIKIMKSKDLREKLIQKGFQRVSLFSWEKTAEQTLSVYEEVKKSLPN